MNKRIIRAQAREARLAGLGYDSYGAYLSSAAWRNVRRRYAENYPMICMCGETKVQLHHTTYDRVGEEDLDDLVPLCRDCHEQAHILEACGIIDLDLNGFYYDPTRAAQGKQLLEALADSKPSNEELRALKRRVLLIQRTRRSSERVQVMFHNGTLSNRAMRHIAEADYRKQKRKGTPHKHGSTLTRHAEATDVDLQQRTFDP